VVEHGAILAAAFYGSGVDPAALVDTDRYPFADAVLLARCRGELAADGVTVLTGFLRPEAVLAMVAEVDALADAAHPSDVRGTPYLALPDESFPEGHPRRAHSRSALSALAYDQFPADSALRALYEWDDLMVFIGELLERRPLHRYADPLGALNVAVMAEGDELGWHFDMTDFVVSIALQASTSGGEFEAATNLRSDDDEHYDEVDAVLGGQATDRVVAYAMTPGTLMLFAGRHSLHRVTPVVGPTPRYVALLAYDTKPDTDSSELLKLVRYGRAA
jgi:hypothetical protein